MTRPNEIVFYTTDKRSGLEIDGESFPYMHRLEDVKVGLNSHGEPTVTVSIVAKKVSHIANKNSVTYEEQN